MWSQLLEAVLVKAYCSLLWLAALETESWTWKGANLSNPDKMDVCPVIFLRYIHSLGFKATCHAQFSQLRMACCDSFGPVVPAPWSGRSVLITLTKGTGCLRRSASLLIRSPSFRVGAFGESQRGFFFSCWAAITYPSFAFCSGISECWDLLLNLLMQMLIRFSS